MLGRRGGDGLTRGERRAYAAGFWRVQATERVRPVEGGAAVYGISDRGDGTAVLLWDKTPIAVLCRHEGDGGRVMHVVQGVAVAEAPDRLPARHEVFRSAGVVWFAHDPTVAEVAAASEHTNRR